MPTCDRQQFLQAAIDSVMAQTLTEIELIIIDDGSGEPTRAMLRAISRLPRVRIFWREHCGNPGAVRNAGVRAARGRYIAFIDSDDVWLPQKLEQQLASLRERPHCRWSYTACTHIDAHGDALIPAGIQAWRAHSGTILAAVACLQAHSALPTVMAERDLLLEAGLFDERMPLFEDHDLWLRLAQRSEADVLPAPLTKVRRHNQHYSGHEALLAAECRAVFLERAWRCVKDAPQQAEVRRMRAIHGARLARLRAASGSWAAARESLRESMSDGWRYSRWWLDAALSMAGVLAGQSRAGTPPP